MLLRPFGAMNGWVGTLGGWTDFGFAGAPMKAGTLPASGPSGIGCAGTTAPADAAQASATAAAAGNAINRRDPLEVVLTSPPQVTGSATKSSGESLLVQAHEAVRLIPVGERPPEGDLSVAHVDDPGRGHVELDAAVPAARLPPAVDQDPVADLAELLRNGREPLPALSDVVVHPLEDLVVAGVLLPFERGAERDDHRVGVDEGDCCLVVLATEGIADLAHESPSAIGATGSVLREGKR